MEMKIVVFFFFTCFVAISFQDGATHPRFRLSGFFKNGTVSQSFKMRLLNSNVKFNLILKIGIHVSSGFNGSGAEFDETARSVLVLAVESVVHHIKLLNIDHVRDHIDDDDVDRHRTLHPGHGVHQRRSSGGQLP